MSITEDVLEADDPRALGDKENLDSKEEWTAERKNAKCIESHANTFKVNERKLLKIEEKKKKKAEQKDAAKTTVDHGQLVQQPPVFLTLEEYMPREWFRMVEEEEKEEVLYSCRMVIINIDFQERNIKITQDNRTRSNAIISTYH